ncbi:hypothetical protein [Streptomyces sp. URMC 129]|uniref:hypothetical protein n=1 Tax=Streptomyces sp. URMC 129 TaxID=3423407 RepID=UPI003F1E127A
MWGWKARRIAELEIRLARVTERGGAAAAWDALNEARSVHARQFADHVQRYEALRLAALATRSQGRRYRLAWRSARRRAQRLRADLDAQLAVTRHLGDQLLSGMGYSPAELKCLGLPVPDDEAEAVRTP